MSDGGLTVLDGSQLRAADLSLPDPSGSLAGAQVLELAESRASALLDGLALPESLKQSALRRLDVDAARFPSSVMDKDRASQVLRDYLTAIADELKDDPLVVAVLDGKVINMLLEDEDDFAVLAENLFTDLDTEDEGKLSKSRIRGALELMRVEMGVPPFSEYPVLNDILKRHGAEGEEKLGQAQFAELLQPVLQDLADSLAEKRFIVVQKIKIANGSKLKKLLYDDKQLNAVMKKIYHENEAGVEETKSIEAIRSYFEKYGKELGLPPSEANDAATLLFDVVFTSTDKQKNATTLGEKHEFIALLKDILIKLVGQLEANPVFYDFDY